MFPDHDESWFKQAFLGNSIRVSLTPGKRKGRNTQRLRNNPHQTADTSSETFRISKRHKPTNSPGWWWPGNRCKQSKYRQVGKAEARAEQSQAISAALCALSVLHTNNCSSACSSTAAFGSPRSSGATGLCVWGLALFFSPQQLKTFL